MVVAQLVRALVCGTKGRGFEPHHPPHFKIKSRFHERDFFVPWVLKNFACLVHAIDVVPAAVPAPDHLQKNHFSLKRSFSSDLPYAIIFQCGSGYNCRLELVVAIFEWLGMVRIVLNTAFLRYLFAKLSMELT